MSVCEIEREGSFTNSLHNNNKVRINIRGHTFGTSVSTKG